MVAKQRAIGESTSVVMEGRDIGTVVFPHAEVKIFLDAKPEERVRRRCEELRRQAAELLAEAAGGEMRERDQRDTHPRRSAPFAGARCRLSGFHRAAHRRSGRGDSQDRARARHQRKGILVEQSVGDEVRRDQRGSRRPHAGGGRDLAAAEQKKRPVAIVVSAMSKITDLLLDTMRHAEGGDTRGNGSNLATCASATKRPAANCCRRRIARGAGAAYTI